MSFRGTVEFVGWWIMAIKKPRNESPEGLARRRSGGTMHLNCNLLWIHIYCNFKRREQQMKYVLRENFAANIIVIT